MADTTNVKSRRIERILAVDETYRELKAKALAYGISLDDFHRLTPNELYRTINLKHRLMDNHMNMISNSMHYYTAISTIAHKEPAKYPKEPLTYETYERTQDEQREYEEELFNRILQHGDKVADSIKQADRIIKHDLSVDDEVIQAIYESQKKEQ